jgi:hypothetical protein
MFCGFGAVVLLVLIINTNIITSREEQVADLRSEFRQQQLINRLADEKNGQLRQELDEVGAKIASLQKNSGELTADIKNAASVTPSAGEEKSDKERISALQQELKGLERDIERLTRKKAGERQTGRRVRSFEGEGNRQYFTGLKLGGNRVLILVDSSASMLDYKLVDIIRRKVRNESVRRSAPKWQKTVAAVEWLIANLPAQSSIQLYSFNSDVAAITGGEKSSWIPVTDNNRVDGVLSKLKEIAPLNGTNLYNVFVKAGTIVPRPDNIILLTDGLPTQGKGGRKSRTVTGRERAAFFEKAVKELPAGVPVNILLFPIEGDPLGSVLFWKTAIDSGGSFLTPSRDWP